MIQTIKIGERTIVYKGIGQLYYESGIPISLSISEAVKQGYEVSLLHIADELIKNSYTAKRILSIFNELKTDNVIEQIELNLIDMFLNYEYEGQR